jgi:hypothetical protein
VFAQVFRKFVVEDEPVVTPQRPSELGSGAGFGFSRQLEAEGVLRAGRARWIPGEFVHQRRCCGLESLHGKAELSGEESFDLFA